MKLRNWMDKLNKLIEENPEALDLDVCTVDYAPSRDHTASEPFDDPSIGHYHGDDGTSGFLSVEAMKEYNMNNPVNAVCLNGKR